MKINIEKKKSNLDPLCAPFLHYWSDLTEIFTQYVKFEKETFFVHENFSI